MSKIKILPENLANQIAAGEVIERPASVVKEFVENAIDAQAVNISVQVEGDGSRLIRVVDDGIGMEEDDVMLCLERHATSKLDSSDQLTEINSLGFRGEAIPSIASVARLNITSRQRETELGNRAEVKFGKIIKVHEMGCAPGTVMEVKNLFGNLPARRKFLKSKQTEISHIDEIMKNFALARPEIGFSYNVQGRNILELPPGDNLAGRVKKIVCRSSSESLVKLAASEKNKQDVCVSGYLLSPQTSRVSGKLRAFVNGRMIKDRMINHAVNEGLQGFLLKGRRAVGVIFISLPPNLVDVNVHPTKQEIRFQKSNTVHDIIVKTVRAAIEEFQNTLRYSIFGMPDKEPEAVSQEVQRETGESLKQGGAEPDIKNDVPIVTSLKYQSTQPDIDNDSFLEPNNLAGDSAPLKSVVNEPKAPDYITEENKKNKLFEQKDSIKQPDANFTINDELDLPVRFVGQLFSTYILCETDDEFLLVDQHAAQERLIFEELLKQYKDNLVPGQVLLFPEVIDLDPADTLIVEQHGDEINRLGLEIKEFGGESYIIKAVPAALGHFRPDEILRGILDRFSADEGRGSSTARIENVLAGMACKASIKAGRRLLPEEVEVLLEQIRKAGIFSHCPHGRPVIKSFSKDEVKKWFLRT